jgi:hypothetical protein
MTVRSLVPQLTRGRRRTGMSAFVPLLRENRTSRGQPNSVEDDPRRTSRPRAGLAVAKVCLS